MKTLPHNTKNNNIIFLFILVTMFLFIIVSIYFITDRFTNFSLTGFSIANVSGNTNTPKENISKIPDNMNGSITENKNNSKTPEKPGKDITKKPNNTTTGGGGSTGGGSGGSSGGGGGGEIYHNPPDREFPNTTLNYPNENYYGNQSDPMIINFICSATDNDALKNLSLYISDNQANNFALYSTKIISGKSNVSSWLVNLNNGNYIWNCLSSDSSANSDWGDINKTLIINYTKDDNINPNTTLLVYSISPEDSVVKIDGKTDFSCSAKSNIGLESISLILNGKLNKTNEIIGLNNDSYFNITLADGIYNWECRVSDKEGNNNISIGKTLVIDSFSSPRYGNFTGETTKWSKVPNIKKVCNAVLDSPGSAKIKWNGCVNAKNADFDKYVKIGYNFIEVDSSFLDPSFNSSAQLTMEYLPWINTPAIYKDGKICRDSCKDISYINGVLTFNITSFSSYTTGANSQLEIWDETDASMPYAGKTHYPGDNNYFFANYTDITTSLPITGAYCVINFSDSSFSMTYNNTKKLYEYNRTFSAIGNYRFNITCSDSGYETLTTSDLAGIRYLYLEGPNGATISEKGSSTSLADAPSNHSAYAGNVTELTISGYSTTQSWQGYYGNVSGTITLSDNSNNVLYNWSSANPHGEVFASINDIVSWGDIMCFDMQSTTKTNKTILEQNYDVNATDPDGVDETFNLNDHPLFYVGKIGFDIGICNNTKVYGQGGAGTFDEVLLYDDVSDSVVFASILKSDTYGFDNNQHDFEMLVLENGHGTHISTTPYYFYIEIS